MVPLKVHRTLFPILRPLSQVCPNMEGIGRRNRSQTEPRNTLCAGQLRGRRRYDASSNIGLKNIDNRPDLCKENNVDAYPQMNLYKDGAFVETFNQPRDLDILREFVVKHAEPTVLSPAARQPPARHPVVTTQSEKVHNPSGTVLVLNEKNFEKTIQEGHVFVKFFAPWCGHCKKLAPIWLQLAQDMRGKLNIAEVDCEQNAGICRSQGVTGYPMLFYYGQRGHGKTEYTQTRRLDKLKAFAEKISGP